MNANTNPQPPADRSDVSDRNVERLIHDAYEPEAPDAAFAEGVRQAAVQAAEARRREQRQPRAVLPLGPWPVWAALAACAVIAAGLLISDALRPPRPPIQPGEVVLTRGPAGTETWPPRTAPGPGGLTAQARPPAPAPETVGIGSVIRTTPTQRRRVTLPDGSVLYVNAGSRISVEDARRLRLDAGEVYVEVAPQSGRRFVVSTPRREVAAVGTKFAVRHAAGETSVLVTQGAVQVSGFSGLLHAGRQLTSSGVRGDEVAAIPRASHVLEWTKDLAAAARSPLVPASQYEGGALVALDPNGQEARLSLRKYHVDVHIEDGFARTTIDQTYFNHMTSRLEGTFHFPLPPDASISRLAMYVDGKLMEGGMAEREHARYVFDDIMYTRRDPALLEWVDGSTFKMRVFPLEPRQEKRILLSYAQRLDSLYGRTMYRFPVGHTMKLVGEWSFHARVVAGGDLKWSSAGTELTATQRDGDLLLDARREGAMPDGDVVLNLDDTSPASADAGLARFAWAEHEQKRYLMLRYRPELQVEVGSAPQRRDWVFLFESSGDRDPLLARAQIDVVRAMLDNAEPGDRLAVLTAGTYVRTLSDDFLPVNPQTIASAEAFLANAHLVGALDLEGALAAADKFLREAENPHLVHVGSGVAVLGERASDKLVALLPAGTRYVGVGVGRRWARDLMQQAAARTGGFFAQVNPDEDVPWRGFEIVSTLNTPRLLGVKATARPGGEPFLLFADSVAQGEEVCAVARFPADGAAPGTLTVEGTLDGQPWRQELTVTPPAGNADYLPRFWAKLEIDRLIAAGADQNKDKIIALSKDMYVMSPFTSLLVLENEQMYVQYKVDRGRKDHWALYPAPAEIPIVREPVGPQPAQRRQDQPDQSGRKPVDQVLSTILVRIPPPFLTIPGRQVHPYAGRTVTAWDLYVGAYAVPYELLVLDDDGDGRLGAVWSKYRFDGAKKYKARELFGLSAGDVLDAEGTIAADRRYVQLSAGRLNLWNGARLYTRDKELSKRLVQLKEDPSASLEGRAFRRRGGPVDADELRLRGDLPWSGPVAPSKARSVRGPFPMEVGQASEAPAPRTGRPAPMMPASREPTITGPVGAAKPPLPGRGGPAWEAFASLDLEAGGSGLFSYKDLKSNEAYYARGDLYGRLSGRFGQRNVLYQRPAFSGDWRVFSDLLSYAPGMNTAWTDVLAVVEAEAAGECPTTGRVDPQARALIDRARSASWEAVTVPDGQGRPDFVIVLDGAGRYAFRRVTDTGLSERVVCDGRTLLHLYDELGLGAKRTVSRFHREQLPALVPWLLPPADDLAVGADVVLAGPWTVEVRPAGAPDAVGEDGKPVEYLAVRLVFSDAGRLVGRRIIQLPSGKTLAAQTYTPEGLVKWLDGDGKVLAECKYAVIGPAAEPNLKPDLSALVVVPMPLRTREYVFNQANKPGKERFGAWSEDEAVGIIAADMYYNHGEAMQVLGQRFFSRGDRRIGFYTLLVSGNAGWDPTVEVQVAGPQWTVRFDPVRDHPKSALARYIAEQVEANRAGVRDRFSFSLPDDGFVPRLARFRELYHRWNSGRATSGSQAQRDAEARTALDCIRKWGDSPTGWAMLTTVFNWYAGEVRNGFAAAAGQFREVAGLSYAARYEAARWQYQAGQRKVAQDEFEKLYADTLQAGLLPAIDGDFRNAFQDSGDGSARWSGLLRGTARDLLKQDARPAAVVLAWQCWSLGDQALAEEMLNEALSGLKDDDRLPVTLTAVEFLFQAGQLPRADALMEGLLENDRLARDPWLWRLAALVAERRGRLASALQRVERAMDIEYADLPEMVNLQAVRSDYAALLTRYEQLAQAVATLEAEVPGELPARIIRAADRWRALDTDDTAVCQSAARVLQALGATDLAWEYLTTPLADKPNESAPWVSLGNQLRQQGELALAERAYASAFQAEGTNAQVLWDRAQLLQQLGRSDEARQIYRRIADGTWPRQFSGVQAQVKRYLGMP